MDTPYACIGVVHSDKLVQLSGNLGIPAECMDEVKKYKKFWTNAGKNIKTLQYIMGNSDVGVTLNVYTHASYDRTVEQMAKILDFKDADM